MIPERASQLIGEIFSELNHPDVPDEAKKEPEVFLLSLLNTIKDELKGEAKFRAILYHAVREASYGVNLQSAREQIEDASTKK